MKNYTRQTSVAQAPISTIVKTKPEHGFWDKVYWDLSRVMDPIECRVYSYVYARQGKKISARTSQKLVWKHALASAVSPTRVKLAFRRLREANILSCSRNHGYESDWSAVDPEVAVTRWKSRPQEQRRQAPKVGSEMGRGDGSPTHVEGAQNSPLTSCFDTKRWVATRPMVGSPNDPQYSRTPTIEDSEEALEKSKTTSSPSPDSLRSLVGAQQTIPPSPRSPSDQTDISHVSNNFSQQEIVPSAPTFEYLIAQNRELRALVQSLQALPAIVENLTRAVTVLMQNQANPVRADVTVSKRVKTIYAKTARAPRKAPRNAKKPQGATLTLVEAPKPTQEAPKPLPDAYIKVLTDYQNLRAEKFPTYEARPGYEAKEFSDLVTRSKKVDALATPEKLSRFLHFTVLAWAPVIQKKILTKASPVSANIGGLTRTGAMDAVLKAYLEHDQRLYKLAEVKKKIALYPSAYEAEMQGGISLHGIEPCYEIGAPVTPLIQAA